MCFLVNGSSVAQMWIGAGFDFADNTWKWKTSGEPIPAPDPAEDGFQNWRASTYKANPDSDKGCGAMQVNHVSFGEWISYICDASWAEFYFICEKALK